MNCDFDAALDFKAGPRRACSDTRRRRVPALVTPRFPINSSVETIRLTTDTSAVDQSLSASVTCDGPAPIPSAVLLKRAVVLPHSRVHRWGDSSGTVLCYCVIHHSHFYHWYRVKQLLNTTMLLDTQRTFSCVDVDFCFCFFFFLRY